MNARIRPVLFFASISVILLSTQKPCRGAIERYRVEHDKIMQRAREQIGIEQKVASDVHIIDSNIVPVIIPPGASPDVRIQVLQEKVEGLLEQARTDPNEITALKKRIGQGRRPGGCPYRSFPA